jgi:hypothetical protein
MSNGSNDFDVSFAQISFLDRLLNNHTNVLEVTRSNDIQFDIERARGGPIRLACLNEYACGLARVFEVQEVFPGVNLIYVGGVWNHYTGDAKQHCTESQIGLFNAKEINGALHRHDFWNYVRQD